MTELVKNQNGLVAVVYYQPIPKLVQFSDKSIYFDCKYAISMAFAEEADVPTLLAAEGGCCGRKRKIITLANQAQYEHWLHGNGGR